MTDVVTQPLPPVAPAPFVPEPLPPSGYADPAKARRAVELEWPVSVNGVVWNTIHIRRFTVDQVGAVVRNWAKARETDPELPLGFPSYVDANGVDVPEDVDEISGRRRYGDVAGARD